MALKITDGELIRLVQRACEYNIELCKKFIVACKLKQLDAQDQKVLEKIKTDVEMMEHQPVTTEKLIERVAVAEPVNYENIPVIERNTSGHQ